MSRPPLPPLTAETATQKVHSGEYRSRRHLRRRRSVAQRPASVLLVQFVGDPKCCFRRATASLNVYRPRSLKLG